MHTNTKQNEKNLKTIFEETNKIFNETKQLYYETYNTWKETKDSLLNNEKKKITYLLLKIM